MKGCISCLEEEVKLTKHFRTLLPEEDGGMHHSQVALQADAALEDGSRDEYEL